MEEIDRISSLPDSVLRNILSFLPTKTCVNTMSLVSRRWRYLWEHLQVFDFYLKYNQRTIDNGNEFKKFAFFVNSVLSIRRSPDIRKMSLSCGQRQLDDFFSNCLDSWIRTAAGPHLQELHLALFCMDKYYDSVFLSSLISCPNLSSLSLCGDIELLSPTSGICLPSLKKLQLDIRNVKVNLLDVLLSGCPNLEMLELSIAPMYLADLHVPSSLKRLIFTVEGDAGVCLEIDTPRLRYLSLTHVTLGEAIGNLGKVDEAFLDVFSNPKNNSIDPLLNLLQALSGIKHLVLCLSTTKWLFSVPPKILPEFHYLLRLEVILPSFSFGFLMNLLQSCSMLQALIVQKDKRPLFPHLYGFEEDPESVPNCLVSHLIFIHLKGYSSEMRFASYALRNGLVLKTMLISDLLLNQKDKWEKYLILKEFSDIPKGSANCQLKFD